jgi:geranylgeranyl pyrophosphate synthase
MKAGALTHKAMSIIQGEGQTALAQAYQKILQSRYDDGKIREALHYYAEAVLPKVLPIFPALINLSSKAVGGTPENRSLIASAMMLITASGDIHDDIVDNSKTKFERKTLFGRYGRDLALLAGDVLLVQGLAAIHETCEPLGEQGKEIPNLIAAAMVEIAKAEAIESALWRESSVEPESVFEVMRLKGCVAELHCVIGGLIGCGTQQQIQNLARYGRTLGILMTLKEEFVDIKCVAELEHRIKHELPPYPMLVAMQNAALNRELEALIKRAKFTTVAEKGLASREVGKLAADFRDFGRKELALNMLFSNKTQTKELAVLLQALAEELLLV